MPDSCGESLLKQHPLLRCIKSRLQVKYYPSAWACARAVVHKEGVRGLFRGVTIPVITITFVRTSSFSIYTQTKQWLGRTFGPLNERELWRTALYGSIGGITSGSVISFASAPFELVKVQRQLEFLIYAQRQKFAQPGQPIQPFKAQTGFQAALDMYRTHGGLRGFYLGFQMHNLRDMLGTALYFGIYDTLRAIGNRMEAQKQTFGMPSPMFSFLIGSSAGILSWLLVYPVDLIKTQVQRDALAGVPRTSARNVFKKLLHNGSSTGATDKHAFKLFGVPAHNFLRLYRGLGISAVRSFISHGITWMIIEHISRELRKVEPLQAKYNTEALDYLDYQ